MRGGATASPSAHHPQSLERFSIAIGDLTQELSKTRYSFGPSAHIPLDPGPLDPGNAQLFLAVHLTGKPLRTFPDTRRWLAVMRMTVSAIKPPPPQEHPAMPITGQLVRATRRTAQAK